MISRTMTIANKLGLHARAAGALVRLSGSFCSDIFLEKDGSRVNSKSIMGILLLAAASCGSQIQVTAEGDDEKEAVAAIAKLVEGKFEE